MGIKVKNSEFVIKSINCKIMISLSILVLPYLVKVLS